MLDRIIAVKEDLGFSVQGTANCKCLGYARAIARKETSIVEKPTIDDRASWENAKSKIEASAKVTHGFGLEAKTSQIEHIEQWCYVIRSLNIPLPSLEGSLEYLKGLSSEDSTSEKEFQAFVEVVKSEFSSTEKAEAYVRAQLKADAVRDHDTWIRLGDEAVRIVQSELDSGTCSVEPVELPEVCLKHVTNTILRMVDREGFRATVTRRQLLNSVVA